MIYNKVLDQTIWFGYMICDFIVHIYHADTYLVQGHSDAPKKYSVADIVTMLEYLIDNIFVAFGR